MSTAAGKQLTLTYLPISFGMKGGIIHNKNELLFNYPLFILQNTALCKVLISVSRELQLIFKQLDVIHDGIAIITVPIGPHMFILFV